jgi:hypothetical protein
MAHAPLHPDARSFLAREVGRAREIAEKGARASLTALAVADKVVPAHFTEAQRKLRNRLRAHARQLGDERTADGQQEVNLLTEEVAYQHWHRMLFARFLAENGLLREDEGDQPIDLDECRALAADRRLDIWVYAALCAQKMLPGVFRLDDPALELKLDGAAQVELNGLMAGLQPEIFKTTDALGWVYQYWQAKRKDEVNDSGGKIGPKEIAPITQLFTEDYMVDFLLHNTLGAWWAGKQGPIEAATEEQARAKAGLPAKNGLPAVEWAYLRFVQDAETKMWAPAGGTFDGWPMKAKDITFIDPCMGSGHFPAFALPLLARMRMEEGGSAAENVYAVLNEQIHGLELDQRCCQIGAFNLALTAWKLAGFQHGKFTLVATNVPYLGIRKQCESLRDFASARYPESKECLSTVFCARMFDWLSETTMAVVTPQNWFYQFRYRNHRTVILEKESVLLIARLGARAFETISGEVVNVALSIITHSKPNDTSLIRVIDASEPRSISEKADILRVGDAKEVTQKSQLSNPDARISLERANNERLLNEFVITAQGIKTGDDSLWVRCFWEISRLGNSWRTYQTSTETSRPYAARSWIINWETKGIGMVRPPHRQSRCR